MDMAIDQAGDMGLLGWLLPLTTNLIMVFTSIYLLFLPVMGAFLSSVFDRAEATSSGVARWGWATWIPNGFVWLVGFSASLVPLLFSLSTAMGSDMDEIADILDEQGFSFVSSGPPLFFSILSGVLVLLGLVIIIPALRKILVTSVGLDSKRYMHNFIFIAMYPSLALALLCEGAVKIPQLSSLYESSVINHLLPGLVLTGVAVFGVGWLLKRDWSGVMDRLRLREVSLHTLWAGLGGFLGITALFFLYQQVPAIAEMMEIPAWGGEEGEIVPWLMAVGCGLVFILGLELLCRGAMLPSLGIVWTSVLSVVIWGALLPSHWLLTGFIFAFSCLLSWLAKRHGVWTSFSLHAASWLAIAISAWFI